jgi:hypothetical protein
LFLGVTQGWRDCSRFSFSEDRRYAEDKTCGCCWLRLVIDLDCSHPLTLHSFFLPVGLSRITPLSRFTWLFLYSWAVIDSFWGCSGSGMRVVDLTLGVLDSNLIVFIWVLSSLVHWNSIRSFCVLPLFLSLPEMMLKWFYCSHSSACSLLPALSSL